MKVGPCGGGCWYCGEDTGELHFCHEFDTFIHLSCIRAEMEEYERDLGTESNPELEIIVREFRDVLAD